MCVYVGLCQRDLPCAVSIYMYVAPDLCECVHECVCVCVCVYNGMWYLR